MYQCYGNDVNDLFDCYLQLYEEAWRWLLRPITSGLERHSHVLIFQVVMTESIFCDFNLSIRLCIKSSNTLRELTSDRPLDFF